MSDLKLQAEAMGIKVDGRWNDERIQQEMSKGAPAPEHKRSATKAFRVTRDFWDQNGDRQSAGTIVDLNPSDDDVLDQIEAGIISRVK